MDVEQGFWQRPAGNTLRWVLFVPAAIAGHFLASVLVGVLFRVAAWMHWNLYSMPWALVAGAGVSGAAVIACGVLVAPPQRRRIVTIVLTAVYCLLGGIAAFVAFLLNQRIWMYGGCAALVAAIVVAKILYDRTPALSAERIDREQWT